MKGNVARRWRAGLLAAACTIALSGLQAGIAPATAAAQTATQQITNCGSEYGTAGTVSSPARGTVAYAVDTGGTWTFACSGTGPFKIGIASTLDVPSGKTVTLLGSGQAVALDGGGSTELFTVEGTLTLDGLTLENGFDAYDGGAIYNGGTLTISNSVFNGNTARNGDIILGAAQPAYGGAIWNDDGTLTVSNSTFSGNSAGVGGNGAGGAIANTGGMLIISNSTFSGNTALRYGNGGAIDNGAGGTLTVSNSTFSGNTALRYGIGGAIDNGYRDTLTVYNSTFSGNGAASGGNLRSDGTTALYNTIVAAATAGGNCAGGTVGGANDLQYGDTTCGSVTDAVDGNPLLGALAYNGGPTQTMALGTGSAALGAGDPAVCASAPVNGFDQRGVARGTTTATCDIGADQATVPSQADLAAQYVMQPSPMAPPGTLASGQTVAVTVYTETYRGAMAPDVPIYLSFTGDTGAASVGGVPLTATPQLFTSGSAGGVVVLYTAGTTPVGSGADTITVADAATNPTLQASDSYSYSATFASLGALAGQFETQPGIASALSAKMGAAAAAAARGNTRALDGALGAFQNAVRAQAGKTMTEAQAAILIREAQELER